MRLGFISLCIFYSVLVLRAESKKNNKPNTTLHHAILHQTNDTIVELMVNKSSIEELNIKDNEGQTPLLLAASVGRKSIVNLLIERNVNLTATNNREESLLHQAVVGGDLEVLEAVLLLNAFRLDIQDIEGNTVLHFVAFEKPKNNSIEMCKKLMEDGAVADMKNNNHKTPLHIAVNSSNIELITTILNGKKNGIDIQDEFGRTPLQVALMLNLTNIFELLINHTANPFIPDIDGRTVIHNAVLKGDIQSLKTVIFSNNTFRDEANAQIKVVDGINMRDLLNYTALHLAANKGFLEAFKLLVKQGADQLTSNRNDDTVLHSAVKGGVYEIVSMLLNGTTDSMKDAQFVNRQNNDGQTALHIAVERGKKDFVDLLLEKNGNPFIPDFGNMSSLELAASYESLDVVKLFAKHRHNATIGLLGLAVANGNDQVIDYFLNTSSVKYLSTDLQLFAAKGMYRELRNKLSLNNLINTTVETQFSNQMCVITEDHKLFITELAVRDEDESTVPFTSKPTLLNIALFFQGNKETVELLMNFSENISELSNVNITWSPIDIAAFRGKKDIVDYLLLKEKTLINRIDINSQTVMHKAAWGGRCEILEHLYKNYSADINFKDKFKRTPLHIAAMRGYSKTVKCILELNSNTLNVKDSYEFTPLHLAEIYGHHLFFSSLQQTSITLDAKLRYKMRYPGIKNRLRNHTETIEYLLSKDADPNAQDIAFGWTILHWAAANGDLDVVRMLIEYKEAKVNLPSRSDQTPLYLARFWGRRDVYDYLRLNNAVW